LIVTASIVDLQLQQHRAIGFSKTVADGTAVIAIIGAFANKNRRQVMFTGFDIAFEYRLDCAAFQCIPLLCRIQMCTNRFVI